MKTYKIGLKLEIPELIHSISVVASNEDEALEKAEEKLSDPNFLNEVVDEAFYESKIYDDTIIGLEAPQIDEF